MLPSSTEVHRQAKRERAPAGARSRSRAVDAYGVLVFVVVDVFEDVLDVELGAAELIAGAAELSGAAELIAGAAEDSVVVVVVVDDVSVADDVSAAFGPQAAIAKAPTTSMPARLSFANFI